MIYATRRARAPLAMAVASAVVIGHSRSEAASCDLPSGNFALVASVSGDGCGTLSSASAQTFFDAIKTVNGLRGVVPGYSETSVATVDAVFNGLPMQLKFPTSDANVQLVIPAIGYNRSFSGTTRNDSTNQLVDDLKKGNVLGQIMNYQAKYTPNSPITGVNGLIPAALASDFAQNFTEIVTGIGGSAPTSGASTTAAASTAGSAAAGNLLGIAPQYGSFSSTNADQTTNQVKVVTLPLSYTIRNAIDPRRQLVASIPLSQVSFNGAKSYSGGLGLAYRFPINDHWTLVPSGRLSALGSVDLATVTGVYTVGLTSVYVWELDTFSLAMGNMLSRNASLKFRTGEFTSNLEIANTSMRNGFMLSQPVTLEGKRLTVEYSITDTRYLGGLRPYVSHWNDFGVTIGTNKRADSARSFLRGGVTYTHSPHSSGWMANIGYWF